MDESKFDLEEEYKKIYYMAIENHDYQEARIILAKILIVKQLKIHKGI